jgi:hypothetical protein
MDKKFKYNTIKTKGILVQNSSTTITNKGYVAKDFEHQILVL